MSEEDPKGTVQTSEPASAEPAKTAADVFREARQSLQQSTDQVEAPAEKSVDETTSGDEHKPDEQTDEASDRAAENAEIETVLTEADLAKLSPKDRANAEKWQARLTQKSQELASRAKHYDAWQPLIDAFSKDRESAFKAIARELGYEVAKPGIRPDANADRASAAVLESLPPELESVRPFLEQMRQSILESVRQDIAPIQQQQDQLSAKAAAEATEATLEAFTAKNPEWRKHELAMTELGSKLQPTAGMTDMEYLDLLYNAVTMKDRVAGEVKKTISKMTSSAQAAETQRTSTPTERVVQALPPEGRRSLRDAYDAARQGIKWGGA